VHTSIIPSASAGAGELVLSFCYFAIQQYYSSGQ